MTTAAVSVPGTWPRHSPHVQRALRYIKSKGAVTAEALVAWDAAHGRRLFTWDDPTAAAEYRLEEARRFMRRFVAGIEGYRVRAFVHVRADEEAGIEQDAYYGAQTVSETPAMRDQVIESIARKMTSLATELKFWRLNAATRARILAAVEAAMTSDDATE